MALLAMRRALVSCRYEPPRVFRSPARLSQATMADSSRGLLIRRFLLRPRDIADRFQQSAVIEPLDTFQCGIFDFVDVVPRSTAADDFIFEQAEGRPGHGTKALSQRIHN